MWIGNKMDFHGENYILYLDDIFEQKKVKSMDYIKKMEGLKNIKELYQLRKELREMEQKHDRENGKLSEINNINFWLQSVEIRIRYLEHRGHSLDNILPLDKKEKKDEIQK